MPNNKNWVAPLVTRVLSQAITGGLLVSIIGALCVGAAGALVGAVLNLNSTPATWDDGFLGPGAYLGMVLGAWSGVLGAFIFGISAAKAGPGRCINAFRALLWRVALGQIMGTLSALSCYFVFVWLVAQTHSQPFIGTVEDNADLIIWGAPALMMGGAIAGALWKSAPRINAAPVAP